MRHWILVSALIAVPAAAVAQARQPAITIEELSARVRLLSSDLFEGRAPGTRGEALTTSYLSTELATFGVRPAVAGDKWLQPIEIVVHDPRPAVPITASLSGRSNGPLEHGRHLRLVNNSATGSVATRGDLVFIGYGIHAPMYRWDDLAGVDLAGKIVIALNGEPTIPSDSALFNGFRASRFSWARDKALELDRRGAVGLLWVTPAKSIAAGPAIGSRRLVSEANRSTVLFTGSIADSTVAGLLDPKGPSYQALIAAANRPGFKPVAIGSSLEIRFETSPRTVITHNVVGTIAGTDPQRSAEHVVLSAHWDAYGIGRPVDGDSIYNGAMDDGAGTTELLALARHFAANPQPRSLTFLFTTAEEWGLLGAEGFVCSGLIAPDRIAANLNLDDGIEFFGRKRDVAPLGIELSSLGDDVRALAARSKLRVTPDPYPSEGFFLRADNFPFAKVGVPSLYLALGTDAEGRPAGWVDEKVKDYLDRHYHRPSDELEALGADMGGVLQLAEFTRDLTVAVATAKERPRWLAGAEFQREAGCRGR